MAVSAVRCLSWEAVMEISIHLRKFTESTPNLYSTSTNTFQNILETLAVEEQRT